MQSNQTCSRKVYRKRITIGSFLAHRLGLRIFARGVFFEKNSDFRKEFERRFLFFGFSRNFMCLGSIIMKLGSEGVYLHDKCGTNASRHLPGPETPVKKLKMRIWGVRAKMLYMYIYI